MGEKLEVVNGNQVRKGSERQMKNETEDKEGIEWRKSISRGGRGVEDG